MKVPRDLSGHELASLLGRFGYSIVRQTGSHIRLTSTLKGKQHFITIPSHKVLSVGTLSAVLADVARYLEFARKKLLEELFGP